MHYVCNVKIHNTRVNTILDGGMKEGEGEIDKETIGKLTSREGQIEVYQSVQLGHRIWSFFFFF